MLILGSGGGQSQSMAEILSSLGGAPSATFGWYAQAHSGTLFDGSQLLAQIEHVVASGAIYQPAGMFSFLLRTKNVQGSVAD